MKIIKNNSHFYPATNQTQEWQEELFKQINELPLELVHSIYLERMPAIFEAIRSCPRQLREFPMQGINDISIYRNWLAIAHYGGIKVLDMSTGQIVVQRSISENMKRISFSKDGRWLASGWNGTHLNKVIVWSTQDFTTASKLELDVGWTTSLAFDPNGRHLAVGARRSSRDLDDITIWDTLTWQKRASLPLRDVKDIIYSPNGKWLIGGGENIKIWDTTTQTLVKELLPTSRVRSLSINPNGTQLAAGLERGSTLVWNTSDWTSLSSTSNRPVYAVSFSNNGTWLAVGETWPQIPLKIWNTTTWELQDLIPIDGWTHVIIPLEKNKLAVATNSNIGIYWTLDQDLEKKLAKNSILLWILTMSNRPVSIDRVLADLENNYVKIYGENQRSFIINRLINPLMNSFLDLDEDTVNLLQRCFAVT